MPMSIMTLTEIVSLIHQLKISLQAILSHSLIILAYLF
jgi:hypothetical protein